MFHKDLFSSSWTMSVGGNYYELIIVDDFVYIFTWTLFLVSKNDVFFNSKTFAKLLKIEKGFCTNSFFFFEKYGINIVCLLLGLHNRLE